MISARDIREFRGYLRNASDRQVQGIYDKESRAGRDEYAELAVEEADRRGIYLERNDHARKSGHATKPKKDRLFIGTFPTGIGYADKQRERDGDYMRVAFLPFSTLELEWAPGTHPPALRKSIERHAANIQSRRGQDYEVSSSGQTVTLGRHHATKKRSPSQLDREISQALGRTAHATRGEGQLIDAIRPGSRVTIVDRFGKQHTGRAVMRGPYGWVLNMGGAHGTPGIATDTNVVKVTAGRRA